MREAGGDTFQGWMDQYMATGTRDVPARLLALLGLLERLRETPKLVLKQHLAKSGMQLLDHNRYVETAISRFKVSSPVQEMGRRSSNLHAWAEALFDWLRSAGFHEDQLAANVELLTHMQTQASARLAQIGESAPLIVRYDKGTAVAVIADLLDQAQSKRRAKDVAEYLVGAKLQLRFGERCVTPKNVNTPSGTNLADFRVGNTAIEVTIAERPDRAHMDQLATIISDTRLEVWFLTRQSARALWQAEIDKKFGVRAGRIAVVDIESFVGQNITEMGRFQEQGVREQLSRLFRQYSRSWLPSAGAAGLQIKSREDSG